MTRETTAIDPETGTGVVRAPEGWPTWTPGPRELADLELLVSGAYRPLTGFLGAADVASVEEARRLADGTPWPVPVTLEVPEELAREDGLVLADPEGVPLAALAVRERWRRDGAWHVAGELARLRLPEYGPFRRLRREPADVRATLPAGPVLGVVTSRPLHRGDLAAVRHAAATLGASVLILPILVGAHPEALVRAVLAAGDELPDDARVVPVPLAERGDADRDALLRAHVAAAYGCTHLLAAHPVEPGPAAETPIPFVTPPQVAYDVRAEAWRPAGEVPPEHRRVEPTEGELARLLDAGEPVPGWLTPPAVARELRVAHPPLAERGLTVFFTGLSGSGKSTVARGLYDALLERGGRTVTLLDGDVVRRLLSAGLTFSRADRDLNIRRIGYVAAEVTRHGGVAICAPIAPYAATRAEVRRMVSEVGGFVLVHVSTPLEECERRDRKGLYAKARAGLISEFTGISDPYEEPDDADVVMDTTGSSPEDAVRKVMDLLVERGWLPR